MKKKEKIQLGIIGVVVVIILSVLLLRNKEKEPETQIWIARPENGTKKQEITLVSEGLTEKLILDVKARQRTEEEREWAFKEAYKQLWELFGVNEGEIIQATENLSLVQYLPETGVSIRWDSMEEEVLSSEGHVRREELEEVKEVTLRAYISYEEETREHWFTVRVLPFEKNSPEARFYRAGQSLMKTERETAGEEGFYLPENIDGITVGIPKERISVIGLLVAIVLFLPIAVLVSKRQEQEKERKRREDELTGAYPRLITKLTLYTGAGLSLRGAWERLAAEYRERNGKSGKKEAIAEEIFLLAGELKNGTSETGAYENFGRRIGLKPYLRCASLLVSQLQKGSGALREGLEQEVRLAWEMQRERAAKKGEEAQTKMLFPMMGMLFLVMAVVVVPAFFSM